MCCTCIDYDDGNQGTDGDEVTRHDHEVGAITLLG